MKSFIDKCVSKELTINDLDSFIDQWHNSSDPRELGEAIGISSLLYDLWVFEEPKLLEELINFYIHTFNLMKENNA